MSNSHFRFRVVLITLVVPLLIAAVTVGLMVSWLPTLPATVAVHWGPDGIGYGSPDVYLFLTGGMTLIMCAIFGSILLATTHSRRISFVQKIVGVSPIFVASILAGIGLVMLDLQRTSSATVTSAALTMAIVAVVIAAIAVTTGAWFVLPKGEVSVSRESGIPIHALQVAPNERLTWIRRVLAPTGFTVLLVFVAVMLLGAVTIVVVLAGLGYWWLFIWPIVIVLALASSTNWIVQIDAQGLRVHSSLGFPRFHVPLDQIARVAVVNVAPLGDFGGWGIRWVPQKRFGVIVRAGESLEVFRHDGRSFVVTVDDAQGAASALAGLVDRGVH